MASWEEFRKFVASLPGAEEMSPAYRMRAFEEYQAAQAQALRSERATRGAEARLKRKEAKTQAERFTAAREVLEVAAEEEEVEDEQDE